MHCLPQETPFTPVDSSIFFFGSVSPFNNTYVFQLRGLIDHLHFVGKNERSAGLIDQVHFQQTSHGLFDKNFCNADVQKLTLHYPARTKQTGAKT